MIASLVVLYTEGTLVLILMNTLGTHYNIILYFHNQLLQLKGDFPPNLQGSKPNVLFAVKH